MTPWTAAYQLLRPWDFPGKSTGMGCHDLLQGIRKLEWMPCPSPEDLSDPGIEPGSLMSPTLAGGFFTTSATWEAHRYISLGYFFLPHCL